MKLPSITDVRVVPGDSGFLIDDGTTSILFDSGFAFTGKQLAENIAGVLGDRSLDYIFLSHSHYDHVLGSAYVANVYPNATVIAGAHTAEVFQKPSARDTMRMLDHKAALSHGVSDYEDLIDTIHVDRIVNDGDSIQCGALQFSILALPGHTKCSIGFYCQDHRLLLATETLGVYFGNGMYLPSYLVGYHMALDSFQRVKQLDIEHILIPHYGLGDKLDAENYLKHAERISIENALAIKNQLLAGKTQDEILSFLEQTQYTKPVSRVYPIDAYHLNTSIMIELIRKEFKLS